MLTLEIHPATLSNLNIRTEKHGDELQLAADLKLSMNVAGVVLNDLEPGLHESLFRKPGSGEQQDLIDPGMLTAVKFPTSIRSPCRTSFRATNWSCPRMAMKRPRSSPTSRSRRSARRLWRAAARR